ncbi:MAG: hypothetical protein HDR80_00865 [Bacteroides sp.]|nr:hypothetical protein [Bacteroides sp.]
MQSDPYVAPHGAATVLAHVASVVLSPLLIPTYAIILVFSLSMLSFAPLGTKAIITGMVFAITCLLPGAAVWLMVRFGGISDVALTQRTDRAIPYLITGCAMLGCGYYLTTTGLPLWVGYFYVGAGLAVGVNLIINLWWKISAHGAGIGGLIAMFLVLNRYGLPPYNLWVWCLAAVLLGGLLGTARVWLGRHTPMQTVCGEIVGFLGVISMELLFGGSY